MALPRASDSEREVGPLPRASSGAAQAAAAGERRRERRCRCGASVDAGCSSEAATAVRPPLQ